MAQQRRFRDVKQKKPVPDTTEEKQSKIEQKAKFPYASIGSKTKAFITDSFMLLMPIMYIVAYFMMDGLQEFSQNKIEGWISILIPNFILVSIFFWKSGQTPGCRAYNIRLIDSKTGAKAHPIAIALRYYFEIVSIVTIVGLVMAYFRQDRKCLHDLLSGTVLIDTEKS